MLSGTCVALNSGTLCYILFYICFYVEGLAVKIDTPNEKNTSLRVFLYLFTYYIGARNKRKATLKKMNKHVTSVSSHGPKHIKKFSQTYKLMYKV